MEELATNALNWKALVCEFDFVFSVDRRSIIADKRTCNLGMQACDESRVVRRSLTAAELSVVCKNSCTNPKIILSTSFQTRSPSRRCARVCARMRRLLLGL
jgi:hypothetical protein